MLNEVKISMFKIQLLAAIDTLEQAYHDVKHEAVAKNIRDQIVRINSTIAATGG